MGKFLLILIEPWTLGCNAATLCAFDAVWNIADYYKFVKINLNLAILTALEKWSFTVYYDIVSYVDGSVRKAS